MTRFGAEKTDEASLRITRWLGRVARFPPFRKTLEMVGQPWIKTLEIAKMRRILLVAVILTGMARATTYYVDPAGAMRTTG